MSNLTLKFKFVDRGGRDVYDIIQPSVTTEADIGGMHETPVMMRVVGEARVVVGKYFEVEWKDEGT